MIKVLNTREPITLHLKQRGKPQKNIVVNWPSDADWIQREAGRAFTHRTVEEGVIDVGDNDMNRLDAADRAIFKSIHVSGEYTEDDALRAIDELSSGSVLAEVERLTVEINALGVVTRHVMREPSYRIERRWRTNQSITRVVSAGRQLIDNLRLAGEVYGEMLERAEGYDGQVPLIHKFAVVKEVFQRMAQVEAFDADGSEDLDPAGFCGATTEAK